MGSLIQVLYTVLFILAAWGCFALMDYFAFHVKPDTGFWSLTTKGGYWKNDIWHYLERLAGLFLILAITYDLVLIGFLSLVLLAVHFFFYRIVGKKWIGKQ